jgi:two-component sensor histidine kinase
LEQLRATLRQREAFLRTMTGASPLAFYVVDNRTGEILYFNPRFCDIWRLQDWQERLERGNVKSSELMPHCLQLVADAQALDASCQRLQSEENREVVEDEILFRDGRVVRRYSTQIRDETDQCFGRLYLFEDITERKRADRRLEASLREKEILLREVYHRVKNNLQVISSLLNLQSGSITDAGTLRLIRETQDRVRSMALVHEKLYRAEDLSRIDFADYARHLAAMLARSYRTEPAAVRLQFEMEDVRLNLDTSVPCGLILNELISNALKYAFPSGRQVPLPQLTIGLRAAGEGTLMLTVADNGVGLPEHLDIQATPTLGLQVVCMLAEQLGGALSVERQAGTRFAVTFKEAKDREKKGPPPRSP